MPEAEEEEQVRQAQAEKRLWLPQGQPLRVGPEEAEVQAKRGQDEVREEELKKGSGKSRSA